MTVLIGSTVLLWVAALAAVAAGISLLWPRVARALAAETPARRATVALLAATATAPIATALLLAVLAPGLLGLLQPELDHCGEHAGHLHLCLVHAPALALAWLAAALGTALAWLAWNGLRAHRQLHATRRAVQALRAQATPLRHAPAEASDGSEATNGPVLQVDGAEAVALTTGFLRPRTFVSRGLVDALEDDELTALLAHERAHVRRREPLRRWLARVGTRPLWPAARRAILRAVVLSSEQVCDAAAARETGPEAVARAILRVEALARRVRDRTAPTDAPSLVAGFGDGALDARIEALLGPATAAPPRRLAAVGWLGGSAIAVVALASVLHHAAEHLLQHALGG